MSVSILTKKQTKTFRKDYTEDGKPCVIIAEVRYDDECGNGHNSFGITGTLYDSYRCPGESTVQSSGKTLYCCGGGCIHDEIAKHFPHLKPFIKWHLTSSDGPMHYIANTVYLAGTADCSGHNPGDPEIEKRLVVEGIPDGVDIRISKDEFDYFQSHKEEAIDIHTVEHKKDTYDFGPKYTFFADEWYKCGFDSLPEAQGCLELFRAGKVSYQDVIVGYYKGKDRELDSARSSAVWPEATDEELSCTCEELTAKLQARLPALLEEFKAAVESLGFTF